MFHVDGESTGEPPTAHTFVLPSLELSTSAITLSNVIVNHQSENTQVIGGGLSEADSGYEASPSSTAGTNSFSFDQVQRNIEPEYDDCIMTFLMDDELSQFDDEREQHNSLLGRVNCAECDSYICFCSIGSVSISGDINSIGTEVETYCPNELSTGLSSSLPVAIPIRSSLASYFQLCNPLIRSNPITDGQQTQTSEQRPYTLPMSWPCVTVLGAVQRRCWHISGTSWTSVVAIDTSRGRRAAPRRDRRRLIDSDASSLSSEDDGPEDVFDAEEHCLSTLSGNAFSVSTVTSTPRQIPRPDLVNARCSFRGRSVSVSFPISRDVADTIMEVGRSLRRFSDEFTERMQSRAGGPSSRRFTIGDFVDYPSPLEQVEP